MRRLNAQNINIAHFTPILARTLEGVEDLNSALREQILAKRAISLGVTKSNRGGWHSESDLFMYLEERTRDQLLGILRAGVEEMLSFLIESPQVGAMRMLAWANVSERGNYNSLHVHPGAVWSGAYYVDAGGDPSSRIVFPDPRIAAQMIESPINPFTDDAIEFAPQPGLLVVFPSWLQHSVQPYQGDEFRISISFNVVSS